jgi:hypothetical protein
MWRILIYHVIYRIYDDVAHIWQRFSWEFVTWLGGGKGRRTAAAPPAPRRAPPCCVAVPAFVVAQVRACLDLRGWEDRRCVFDVVSCRTLQKIVFQMVFVQAGAQRSSKVYRLFAATHTLFRIFILALGKAVLMCPPLSIPQNKVFPWVSVHRWNFKPKQNAPNENTSPTSHKHASPKPFVK